MQRRIWKLKQFYRRWHDNPVVVPIATFSVMLVLTAVGFGFFHNHTNAVPNAYVVILNYDHHSQTVPTHEPTIKALLDALHIPLHEGDVVEPNISSPINQEDFRVNIYRAVPVEILDGVHKTYTFSAATTPRSIAHQSGVDVYAEDALRAQPSSNVLADGAIGEQVVINRSTPVNINLYGALTLTRTHAHTVAELMSEKNIKLAKDDQVTPTLDTPLTPNVQVVVARNGTKLETITEAIPMPVQQIQDNTLAFGTSAVRQQGSAGQQVTTYQDKLVNGQVVGRTPIQTVVTQPPVTQILVVGTSLSGIKGDMALAGIGPGDYNYVDYIVSHESGWCPTKAQGETYCPAIPDNAMTPNGYGLCQATPGYKMQTAGSDWQTNPVTQLKWCNSYAMARYGSWYAAYNHWLANHNW